MPGTPAAVTGQVPPHFPLPSGAQGNDGLQTHAPLVVSVQV
ncbi:MAG TPA: hypothetical protein VMT89_13915 [Candidatus Acidoferrales bacterium]|nr:hypothetical protein [Candidatus Acidoferrales bacterium]